MTKLYGNKRCDYTKKVELHLKKRNVEYHFVDTDKMENAKEMVNLTGQMGVPVVCHQGKIIIGWNPKAIDSLFSPFSSDSAAL